jgi:hypothetical protein
VIRRTKAWMNDDVACEQIKEAKKKNSVRGKRKEGTGKNERGKKGRKNDGKENWTGKKKERI